MFLGNKKLKRIKLNQNLSNRIGNKIGDMFGNRIGEMIEKNIVKNSWIPSTSLIIIFLAFSNPVIATENKTILSDKKLKIIFMFGQAEMVGHAKISSASYMLREPVLPPKEVSLNAHKGMLHQINGAYLYWQAMEAYIGPKKSELKALIKERTEFRIKFKQHVIDTLNKNDGNFRGKHYKTRRGFWLFNMNDLEAEKVGITPKIRAILDDAENKFNVNHAYEQLSKDCAKRYEKQKSLNKKLLLNTKIESFNLFNKASQTLVTAMNKNTELSAQARRKKYAELALEHLNLPLAEKTYIVSIGGTAGTPLGDIGNISHGLLSIGFGSDYDSIGLEYSLGLALEKQIDSPVLIIKCAFNKRESIKQLWCTNEEIKKSWAMEKLYPNIKMILANLKKYHPSFNEKLGYDISALVWFQGMKEGQNENYGKHFLNMVQNTRNYFNTPELPVVFTSVGNHVFKQKSDAFLVNQKMKEIIQDQDHAKSISVVDSRECFPGELGRINALFFKRKLSDPKLKNILDQSVRYKGKRSPPYMGAATFYLLTGHELGMKLSEILKQ